MKTITTLALTIIAFVAAIPFANIATAAESKTQRIVTVDLPDTLTEGYIEIQFHVDGMGYEYGVDYTDNTATIVVTNPERIRDMFVWTGSEHLPVDGYTITNLVPNTGTAWVPLVTPMTLVDGGPIVQLAPNGDLIAEDGTVTKPIVG